MNLIEIAILGLVQGLTEFLPISSSGHLVLFPKLFGWADPGLVVDAFLHLGTLAAVLIYFRKDLWELCDGLHLSLWAKLKNPRSLIPKIHRKMIAIIVATIPVVIVGFTFKPFFESSLVRSIPSIAFTLSFGAILLWFSERYGKQKKDFYDLSLLQIFLIGTAQILALFPGFSRSGATIIAGLFAGLKRDEAAKFSFLVGVPAVGGAGLLSVKDLYDHYSVNFTPEAYGEIGILLLGLVVSFVSGLFAIDFLIKFLRNNPTHAFVIYRIILAAVILF